MATVKPLIRNATIPSAFSQADPTDTIEVGTPTTSTHAANRGYVDAQITGALAGTKNTYFVKAAALTDIGVLSGLAATADGIALNTAGDLVLLTAQSVASQNGIYQVAAGAWTRTLLTVGQSAAGTAVRTDQGTVWPDTTFICKTNSGVDIVGTNSLNFEPTNDKSLVGGDGIVVDSLTNEIDVDLAANSGLEFNLGQLRVDVADTTITRDASGLSVRRSPVVAESFIASTILAQYTPVYVTATANRVAASDAASSSTVLVAGITLNNAASALDPVEVAMSGVVTGCLTGATPGQVIYLGTGGGLTGTVPAAPNYQVKVGIAKNSTDLIVQISEPIALAL